MKRWKKSAKTALATAPVLAVFVALFLGCLSADKREIRVTVSPPPPTSVTNDVDELHGIQIADPYRWLEDQESPKTRTWLAEQNKYTDSILEQIPGKDSLREKITKLIRIDVVSTPVERGGRYFLSKRKAEQALSVIYMREGVYGRDQMLIDPHPLSKDHTTSVDIVTISKDGKLLAYSIRKGGVDETEVRILDVDTRKELPDAFPFARYFGFSFTLDNSGLYYTKFTQEGSRVYFHKMGTDLAEDRLVFGEGLPPSKIAFLGLSEDGKWLIAHVLTGTSGPTEIHLKSTAEGSPWKTVINDGQSRSFGALAGSKLAILTNLDALNQRVMIADANDPSVENWRELVPEDKEAVLEGAAPLGGMIVCSYLKNVQNFSRIFGLEGRLVREITFDTLGSFGTGSGSWESSEAFFSFSSFHIPPTIYRYDIQTGEKTVWARIEVPVDSASMELKQIRYPSKDGTLVPMFILHKKGVVLNGKNPTILSGYGGFNASVTPYFSAHAAAWVESGGIFCLANLRGGGEFGEEWHRAGMLENKQNVFDDFIAAGEWLVKNRYTSPEHLGILGGSNGGLLVGACMVQQPGLFGAVVCTYPLLDMIRYHKFMVGQFWVSEYGCSDDPNQFKYLLAYSPYHNVKENVTYPATLFVTGDGDTRVAPLHARKMAALLQAKNSGNNPIMLRYHVKAGHSGGMPVDVQIEESVDLFSFLKWQLGLK